MHEGLVAWEDLSLALFQGGDVFLDLDNSIHNDRDVPFYIFQP